MTKDEFKSKFKDGFEKFVKGSKKAFGKAGNAVQDFSDKSVIRIEKKQFESKRKDQYEKLGKLVFDAFSADAKSKVSVSDDGVPSIMEEIKRLSEEIKSREDALDSGEKKSSSSSDSEPAE